MKIRTCILHGFVLLLLLMSKSQAKSISSLAQDDSTAVQIERVRELITYLEFALNTLGDPYTPPREKDVIITTSYSKFFRDEDVQVEDDLDLNRSTVTNKDVQAYLKDVEFFFKNVSFKLDIEEVQPMLNDSSQLFYLVKINRNLSGVTVLDDTINQSITRFVEVNYYEERDDLKIVSFYTTKLSEKEDLMNWWEELSFEWKYIFQQKFNFFDSVGYEQLKELIKIDSLDLSSNRYIEDFEPLFKLDQLIYLDLSNTNIKELTPLRIHNKIRHLDLSDTNVDTLDYIKYAAEMMHLNISGLKVDNLSVLNFFPKLASLKMEGCAVDSISFRDDFQRLTRLEISHFSSDSYDWLFNMPGLQYLDASYSNIEDLMPLSGCNQLKTLILAGTSISDLSHLHTLPSLEILNLEATNIQSLEDISGMASLRKIYCDNSNITIEDANDFMNINKNTLVIFESERLQLWWDNLDNALQNKLSADFNINLQPSIDELARITKNDSLDLSGLKTTKELPELWPFRNLVYLDIHDTYISEISTITQAPHLTHINAGFSNISVIDSLQELKNLSYVDLRSTRVSSLKGLSGLRALDYLNIDDAQIPQEDIRRFIDSNPECLVIYRTVYLVNWWEGLSPEWQKVLSENAGLDPYHIDERTLHIITYLEKIKIDSADIPDLNPLSEFYYLKSLEINHVRLNSIQSVREHKGLTSLKITASPIMDLTPVSSLVQLRHLDISNTGITDLEFLEGLKALEVLKIGGTKVKKLDPLEDMMHLKELDISNTEIKKLKSVEPLPGLEMLICYNTNIKSKIIDGFQEEHPDCRVVYY